MPELREGFDEVADLYDRIRPKYPDDLFTELFSRLPQRAEIVEVGPATGQATGSLLAHHARVTAVELGRNLAGRLRRNFQGHDVLDVIVSSFEEVDLSPHSFDAVVAATSYHWVSVAARLEKPFNLLRPGGWLAVIDTVQVSAPTDRGFFERVQPVYDEHGQGHHGPPAPQPEEASSPIMVELEQSALFGSPLLYRYRWDQTYSTSEYIDLMGSYSGTQAMPKEQRAALLADMSKFIDEKFNGHVTRPLVIVLTLAQTISDTKTSSGERE
jgi:SAM-dependent methyltransferase